MKATAVSHPIQGMVKYHGMRDHDRRYPYHDSISLCTAPSRTITTVAFEPDQREDTYIVDGSRLSGTGKDRLATVVEAAKALCGRGNDAVHLESQSTFPTNVGLGSSASGMAAAAVATAAAGGGPVNRRQLSGIARLGSASAARAVTGGFSLLAGGADERTCRSQRLESPLEDEVRVVAAIVDYYKETGTAHQEAAVSPMFQARLAQVHDQLATVRAGLEEGEFDRTFGAVEADTLSLAATTMTGPDGWVYWQPATLEVFNRVRTLRREENVPAYFSTDTGASVYINTTEPYVDTVREAIADIDLHDTRTWHVGGPTRVDDEEALF